MTQLEQYHYIGLDVAKTKLDLFSEQLGKKCFVNESTDILRLIQLCQSIERPFVVCEATSHYHIPVVRSLQDQGIKVGIMNPRFVRSYAKAMGHFEKTDSIDAKVIACFARAIEPRASAILTEQSLKLQTLYTRQRQLTSMLALEKTHLEGLMGADLKEETKAHIQYLNTRLKAIEEMIDVIIGQDGALTKKAQVLGSMPGIGKKTARLLMIELPELGQLSERQVVKLVGLAPLNRDSGAMKGQRSIHGGRMSVRNGLYMACLSSIRHDKRMNAYYQHLRQQGKKPKVAIVACMRKMLIILNAMIKNESNYVVTC